MTDDEILVHKLELAITGRTVIHYDLDNPSMAPGTVAHRLGATRWRTDRHHHAIIFSIEPEDITRNEIGFSGVWRHDDAGFEIKLTVDPSPQHSSPHGTDTNNGRSHTAPDRPGDKGRWTGG